MQGPLPARSRHVETAAAMVSRQSLRGTQSVGASRTVVPLVLALAGLLPQRAISPTRLATVQTPKRAASMIQRKTKSVPRDARAQDARLAVAQPGYMHA